MSVLETSVVESADGSEVFYQQTLRRPDGSRVSYQDHSTQSEEAGEENPLPRPRLGRWESVPPEGYFLFPALPVGQKFVVPRSRIEIETISTISEQTTLLITFQETWID